MKVSFLIPAYNEEKRIGIALDNLARLRKIYRNIEVLCGNDGSTDRTEEIIKKYKFVKYYKTNKPRSGKHFVINRLMKMATGDIIVIHDADRIFVCGKGELERMLECFKDPKVGGLGDYYTTTFDKKKVKTSNSALYLGDAWSTLFMLEYKMKHHTDRISGKLYTKNTGMMFYVNFFRKKLAEKTLTLCDDGEHFIHILNRGYKVRLLETEQRPYLKAVYSSMKFRGFLKTKVRGMIAQKQIDNMYGRFSIRPPVGMFLYILKNLHRVKRPRAYLGIFLWWSAAVLGAIRYRLMRNKKISTKEGWKMRMKVY